MNIFRLFFFSMVTVVCVVLAAYPGYYPLAGTKLYADLYQDPRHNHLFKQNIAHDIFPNPNALHGALGQYDPYGMQGGYGLQGAYGAYGGYGGSHYGYVYVLPAESGGIIGTVVTVIGYFFLLFVVIMTFGYINKGYRKSKSVYGNVYGKHKTNQNQQTPIIIITGPAINATGSGGNTSRNNNNESDEED